MLGIASDVLVAGLAANTLPYAQLLRRPLAAFYNIGLHFASFLPLAGSIG